MQKLKSSWKDLSKKIQLKELPTSNTWETFMEKVCQYQQSKKYRDEDLHYLDLTIDLCNEMIQKDPLCKQRLLTIFEQHKNHLGRVLESYYHSLLDEEDLREDGGPLKKRNITKDQSDCILDVFRQTGIRYLHQIEVQKKIEKQFQKACLDAHKKFKKSAHRQAVLDYIAKSNEEGMAVQRVAIKDVTFTLKDGSTREEKGVFATQSIQKGEIVGIYTGIVSLLDEEKEGEFVFGFDTKTKLDLFGIDAEKAGNAFRFLNHSESPNIEIVYLFQKEKASIAFIAKEDIQSGRELTISYGEHYVWPSDIVF